MSKLRAAVERARDQFRFYGTEHRQKEEQARERDRYLAGDMKHIAANVSAKKAEVNEDLANEMQAALDSEPLEVLALEKVQDYRFASMTKGQHYAFARGLTINPVHLPAALDAMKEDGYELVAIFGEPVSDKMGFIFKMTGPNKRVDELLAANSKLVLERRALQEKYDELKFRMDGLEK